METVRVSGKVLSKILKKTLEARFQRAARSRALKNRDREKKHLGSGVSTCLF
jgi:hypothetical protein